MTERRAYLDVCAGETRGVVTLDGRPERLLISRPGGAPGQVLGARLAARVRAIDRASGLAFIDLGGGPDGVLNLTKESGKLAEGQFLEVEVRSEARGDKGPALRLIGPATGPQRLIEAGPSLEAQLLAFAPGAEIRTGGVARSVADGAQQDVLASVFPLSGGGSVAIEPTRALTAVDVDLGARPGAEAKSATRAANMAALALAARVLRLKGLGGLVVVDLVGRGHDGPALVSAARAAFGPDNPGVAVGAVSRFGTLELTVPRRARPAWDILTDGTGVLSVASEALDLARSLEREALADRGGRFEAAAAPEVAEAAAPALAALVERLGARLAIRADVSLGRGQHQVGRL